MKIDKRTLRIAVLAVWLDLIADSDLQSRVLTELWCLRNDVDTTALWDLTVAATPTQAIIDDILSHPERTKNEHASILLCTLLEVQ